MHDLWSVNPVGAYLLHCKKIGEKGPIWWNSEFIGFSDGAWENSTGGSVNSGMGGILIDNLKNIIFSFSCSIKATNPLLAEREAMLFLWSSFKSSSLNGRNLQLYTDSMTLVDIASKNKGGIYNVNVLVENGPWLDMISDHKIKIAYASRDFLRGADSLAKQGKDSGESRVIWC